MKIIFYCLPGLLDHIPDEVEKLSQYFDVDLIFEVTPNAWKYNVLDLPYPSEKLGIINDKSILLNNIPQKMGKYFDKVNNVYFLNFPSLNNYKSFYYIYKAAKFFNRLSPSYIYMDGESIRGALISFISNIPVVLNVHEPTTPIGSKIVGLESAKRYLIPKAKKIITHSNICKKEILRRFNIDESKIDMIILGPINMFRYYLKDQNINHKIEKNNILFFGNLSPRKGIEVFIRAIPLINQHIKDANFIIAGRKIADYELPNIDTLVDQDKIKIIDRRLKNWEIAELVNNSKLIVCPYIDVMQSGVISTAFAFKKIVVASDIEGMREQISYYDNGLFFKTGDSVDLANVVIDILINKNKYEELETKLKNRFYELAEWEHYGLKIKNIFLDLYHEKK